jgi:type I restriction enzyme S subunit
MREENDCYAGDWELIPFNSNIEMLSGFPFDSNNFNDSKGTPLIRIRNIISGSTETFYDGEYSNDFIINRGDILIGMDGDFHIRRWKGAPSLLNQRILKIYENKKSKINLEFFYYLAQPFLLNVHKRTAGTTVKHLSIKDFRNASFKVPKYSEQQKIAEILSTVDAKIDVIDQQINETQALKKGLMQRLLTKGIGHMEFKDSALGEIPKSWEVVEIQKLINQGRIISHLDGNHGGLYPSADEFINEGIPYIGANCFLNNRVDFSKCKHLSMERSLKFKKGVAKNGDVLFAHNATVGPVAFLETNLDFVILSTTATYYRLDNKTIDAKYWMFFLSSPIFKTQYEKVMGQSTRNQVPITMQRTFYSVLPSFEEQKEISEILNTADNKLEILLEKKNQYQELKQGLMQQLLTGKLRVKTN